MFKTKLKKIIIQIALSHISGSFQIHPGNITTPLHLIFYDITEKQDQEKLTTIIEHFFKETTQKQRKIKIYKSKHLSSIQAEEEKLIFKLLIK